MPQGTDQIPRFQPEAMPQAGPSSPMYRAAWQRWAELPEPVGLNWPCGPRQL